MTGQAIKFRQVIPTVLNKGKVMKIIKNLRWLVPLIIIVSCTMFDAEELYEKNISGTVS